MVLEYINTRSTNTTHPVTSLDIILFQGINPDPSRPLPDEAKWLTLADCYAAASCTTNRLCIHIPSNPIPSLHNKFPLPEREREPRDFARVAAVGISCPICHCPLGY